MIICNEVLANMIKDFLITNEVAGGVTIYFNEKAYRWNSDGSGYTFLKDIKASNYFEGANDELVSMSFEGVFYDVINRTYGGFIADKFDKLLEQNGYYYDFYNSWNLSIYEN